MPGSRGFASVLGPAWLSSGIGLMQFTPFESEILDSILWQVEGFKIGRVIQRATTRILRATIRRTRPRLIARSEGADASDSAIRGHGDSGSHLNI